MSEPLALLVRMFLIGIAVAAPVGAMGVLCIQRTLDGGWRDGIATGLGIATADAIYAGCAAFGLAALSTVLVTWQTPLRLAGGAILIYLGLRSVMTATSRGREASRAEDVPAAPAGSLYLSAVGLTLTNPMTIMAFGAVFAGAGLVAAPTLAQHPWPPSALPSDLCAGGSRSPASSQQCGTPSAHRRLPGSRALRDSWSRPSACWRSSRRSRSPHFVRVSLRDAPVLYFADWHNDVPNRRRLEQWRSFRPNKG